MKEFIFDLQRFATSALTAGKSTTIDGVTYKAVSNAVLNLDGGKVTGIASGSVTATLKGNSAVQVTFDGSKAFDFSCSAEDDALGVTMQGKSIKFTSGTISCSADGVSAKGEVSVTGFIAKILPFNLDLDIPDSGMNITLDSGTKITAPEKVDATLTFPENIAEIVEELKPVLAPLLHVDEATAKKIYEVFYKLVSSPTTAQLEGTFAWNQDDKKLIINKDSNLALNILDYDLSMTAKDGSVDGMSFFAQFTQEDAAVGARFTPSTDQNAALQIKLDKNGSQICDGLINITAGSIDIDILNGKTSVEKDTCVTFTQGDDTFQFKFDAAATLTYSADKKGISQFTFGNNDGKVDLTLYRDGKEVLTANVEINGTITVDTENHSIGMTKDTTATIKLNDSTYTLKATDDAGATVAFQDDKFILTPNDGNGGINIAITKDNATVFGGTLNVTGGIITFDPIAQKFSFTEGTNISFAIGDGSQEIDFEVKDSDASFKIEPDSDGSFTITPDTEDGSVDVTLKRGGKTVFENNLSVTGPIIFNPATQLLTLKNGTTVSVTFNNYTLTATAAGNASSTISMTKDGILITPNTTDKGKLKLTLTGTSSGSLSADIEVLSGSILFGFDGNLTVTKDTELQVDFGNNYIVDFKATDKAGGVISIGSDGITFKPSSDEKDGGLQLTVKRGNDSRSASLDVTGSVTYKLDGSISLTKGTVVKNVFDDGNILTITANTDASGSILFNPQTGLDITPTTADALTVSLQTGDLEVVKITSITGSINYQNGIVTATDGTKARIKYYFGWESDLYTKGGSASLQFTEDRTIYTANDGATFVIDYLDSTTAEIQNGSYADVYGESIENYVEYIYEGSTFRSNDEEVVFTLEKAGNYMLNGMDITTSKDNTQVQLGGDYDTVHFAAGSGITVTANDKGFRFGLVDNDGNVKVTSTESGDFGVSSGSITFGDKEFFISKGTVISLAKGEQTVTLTATKDISAPIKIEDGIYYLNFDDITADASVTQDGQTILTGELEIDGVFSYNPKGGTFGLTGADSSHGDGNNTSLQFTSENGLGVKLATHDTTVVFIPKFADGKLEFNFPNERKDEMLFTLSRDGQTIFENQVTINGTVGFDTAKQELSLTKDTVLTLKQGENAIEITALADAGGKLSFVEGGIRFAPNTGDGQLELNFVSSGRKANIDVTGAIVLSAGGKISLEDGTEVNLDWEDGTNLKLTSHGSTGSIAFGEKGIRITSEDENLDMTLTTPDGYPATINSIQGSVWYNAGTVTLDAGTSMTGKNVVEGHAIGIKVEAIGGDASLNFSKDCITYKADKGKTRVTYTLGDEESSFTLNKGSVFIKDRVFHISEGSDISTDFKDFIPAQYFQTQEAGTYTINGQTITTSAANLALTANDDYMSFKTSNDVVTYNGMTFAGNGNVSLSNDNGVVLGAGVEASGFGKDKSFVLAEAGNVTADARVFELTEEVPTGITVTGAQDGFIFSRTNTEESEARFDDPDPENVGKIFTEEFFLTNDDSYRIQTDLLGLQQIIGVSAPSTVKGEATFGGEPERTVFDVVTETEGVFTVDDKDYSISGDDSVAIKVGFEPDKSYVRGFDSLSGTVSGDFTAHEVSINGSASAVQPIDDTLISISADDSGFEVSGLDDGASLKVFAKDTYVVNGTTINANGGDYIMGLDNGAALYGVNNDTIITGTEGNDTITNSGTNVTINALGGDDSISNSGDNASIDAGAGDNQIKLSGKNEVILLKGRTTVEGFNTGFGDGSDTIYIKPENDPAGVEFLDDGLTFGNDTASLTLSDVNTTAKVNLFHENRDMLNKGVFISAGDWYKVEDSDFTIDEGEEVYFVGTAAKPSAGIDFSDITADLNVTMNTAYIDEEEYVEGTPFWVNGIYSLKGGAGNTTITGSKLDDTIISGTGETTIDAAGGDDLISLSGSAALINYAEGDGNDTIYGFDETSTLSPDSTYKTQVSGNDLIVTVGDSKITLVDAADLELPNIESSSPIVKVVEAILKRTEAGYPVIAGLVFNPEEITGPEPTNYSAKEDWSITSADNLELYGVHYTPENSNDKWVVLVHGYGCNYESMNPFASFYLANNYNVLMIDQRAAGKSEGTWLTMGVAESQDVALWTQEIASRYPDSKITLHGVSMGASTALLAAARSDVVNVTAIVEDCGYSDVLKTFDTIVSGHPELAALGISSEIVPLTDPVAESLTGYYLHDAAPIDSIATVKKPTLFISGDDDGVAPVSMLHELYDESGAEVKEKFIVKGAGHARSGFIKPLEYSNAVFRFVAEANGEGWDTENIAENISLRGTKYNDTLANVAEGVTIDAGEGDDYISNIADNVAIYSGEGDDTIYNHADNITIDAGLGNNSISNNSDNVVFIWSGGNDTIEGFKEDSVLQIAATKYSTKKSGDDIIVTVGDDELTLVGAASLDTIQIIDSNPTVISNTADDTLIIGSGGDDSITNSGDNVTIKVYGGDDTVNNTGAHAVIDGSDGADSISNYSPTHTLTANGVSINAGAGDDTIRNHHAYYVTLEGGSGDDHISVLIGNQTYIDGGIGNDTILGETVEGLSSTWAMGGYATINGGEGDDYINPGFSDSASIMGGDGNDTIINEGDDATINGGLGDDVISLHGASLNNDVIKYDVGSGNDSIFGFNETSQLSITAGTEYKTQISGDDVLVTVVDEDVLTVAGGKNVLTIAGGASLSAINIVDYEIPALNISNSKNNTLITGTELADTIKNTGSNVTISGRASNDSIISSGAKGSLNGDAGNDTIENRGANATVEGYYGDDKLTNSGEGVSISGNYGNDTIINSGDNVTISGGSGFDSIINRGSNVLIEFTGGQDSVWGYNATTKLKTAAGASSVIVDDDIIVTVGEDKITLVDAASVVPEEIVLTKKGAVTVGNRVFELTENVKSGVTITSTEDGFTSGITEDDGTIFVEEFIAKGDDSYHVLISGDGLEIISGIDAGTTVTSSATEDGEASETAVHLVTEDDGKYTLNDMAITATNSNTEILLANYGMAFAADAGVEYDGKTFAGAGNVSISPEAIYLGAGVSATGFDTDEFILTEKGKTTVNGRTFELTEEVPTGITVKGADNDYTFSHVITEKEATLNNVPDSYIGKTYSEEVHVAGDETYSLQADTLGLRKVRGISDGATINGGDTSIDGDYDDKYAQGGQNLYVETDTEGTFTIGEKPYTISGDSSVEIKGMFLPEKSYAGGFASLSGTVSGNFDGDEFFVNGSKDSILVEGDDSIDVVGSSDGTKLYGLSDGASLMSAGGVSEVHTDTEGVFQFSATEEDSVAITVQGDDNVTFELDSVQYIENIADIEGNLMFSETLNTLFINGMGGTFEGDFSSIGAYDNSLYIHDVSDGSEFTTGDADKIWLQMRGETFTLNGNELTLTADSDGIWLRDKEIVGLDAGASLQVSEAGTYTAGKTKLKAKAGDVIIGLEGDDAYIYDADNPLITPKTPNAEIIEHFKPKNSSVVGADASREQNITLNGGDLAIVEASPDWVNIKAGDDTIVSQGRNVHVTLTPEKNTWLFPIDGKMTLEGYDESTGSGFGTTYSDIVAAVADGTINFNDGRLKLGAAKVKMGKSSELMNFFDRVGNLQKVGYASQNDSLDVSGKTEDLLLVTKKNGTIISGSGNDTILATERSSIDGGAGSNLVSMSSDSGRSNIVLHGDTTVKGFHTGFGNGSDTIYIKPENDPAGVEFLKEGLTFGNDTASLTLSDVHTTAKVNLFHENRNMLNKGVFIAQGDWYKVEDSDLTVNEGEEVYFVGTAADPKAGVDFSGVTGDLNITMDTAYIDSKEYVPGTPFWVNGVYSLRGGAGNTSITGSKLDDTILAGTGATSINGGAGNDSLFGNDGKDTFFYLAGDGHDTISNFNFLTPDNQFNGTDDKIDITSANAVTNVIRSGDDVILQINNANDYLTIKDAVGKDFRINDLIAKVDTNIAYDGLANCYVAKGGSSLTVDSTVGSAEIWLDNSHGTLFLGEPIRTLDASAVQGNTSLVGNEYDNTIIAGQGDSSLWGGSSTGNDLLQGGKAHNTFFYCQGNGKDTITGANDGDNVILDGITLDQISSANIYAGSVSINFNDGGSLTINGTANVTYQLADGSRYSANHQSLKWDSK